MKHVLEIRGVIKKMSKSFHKAFVFHLDRVFPLFLTSTVNVSYNLP